MSSTQLVSKSRETPCTGVLNIAIVHALCVCERAFSALYGAHRRLYEWGRRRHNRHCKRRVLQLAVDERFRRSLSVLFSRCSFESTSAEKDFSFFFFFPWTFGYFCCAAFSVLQTLLLLLLPSRRLRLRVQYERGPDEKSFIMWVWLVLVQFFVFFFLYKKSGIRFDPNDICSVTFSSRFGCCRRKAD